MTRDADTPAMDQARVITGVFEAFAAAAAAGDANTAEADRILRIGQALADAAERPAEDLAAQPPSPRG